MKHIKPGRGPSMMSGIVGIFMICFGIFWTLLASQASGIFALFGVVWTAIAVVMTVYHFKNATSENRYSHYDIVDGHEEPDPFDKKVNKDDGTVNKNFCPYCGARIEDDYKFCIECGKELPK